MACLDLCTSWFDRKGRCCAHELELLLINVLVHLSRDTIDEFEVLDMQCKKPIAALDRNLRRIHSDFLGQSVVLANMSLIWLFCMRSNSPSWYVFDCVLFLNVGT